MTEQIIVYVGKREAIEAEVGLLPCYQGKYIVRAMSGVDYTPDAANTLKDAKLLIRQWKEYDPNFRIVWL